MRRQRRESWWIDLTATKTAVVATVVAVLATMILTVQSTQYNLLNEPVPIPEFLPGTMNVTVREGDMATLPCSVRYLGAKQVVWRKVETDQFLTIGKVAWGADSNVEVDYERKSDQVTIFDLVIKNVKPEDAGSYECQVTSTVGHNRLVNLSVVGPPITKPGSTELSRHHPSGLGNNLPNVTISVCGALDTQGCLISITGKRYVDLGEKIHLICNASGGPRIPDEIDWFKAGDKIDSDKYSSVSDTGDYICRSSRNDIANLKVTVLHAESVNKRRGSDQERLWFETETTGIAGHSTSRYISREIVTDKGTSSTGPGAVAGNFDYDSAGQSPRHGSLHTLLLAACLLVTLLTLYSAPFGLYS